MTHHLIKNPLKALRKPGQKKIGKKIKHPTFSTNRYLQCIRSYCENFEKLYVQFQRKAGNKSYNLAYCISLHPIVVHSFSEIESNFRVPFQD